MSIVSEESKIFIAERHRHVDDTAGLWTETWRTLKTDRQVLLDIILSLCDGLPVCLSNCLTTAVQEVLSRI